MKYELKNNRSQFLDFALGDDAEKAVWRPVDRTLELYASHRDIIKAAVDRLDAFW